VSFTTIFALALLLQLGAAHEEGVRWAMIDPFCGQLTSTQPELFSVRNATLKLYRAAAKHVPCCTTAELLGSLQIDANGNFDLRKLAPGQYWLIVRWKKTEVPVALWSDGNISSRAMSDTGMSLRLGRTRRALS
jgi:hypothetical protein